MPAHLIGRRLPALCLIAALSAAVPAVAASDAPDGAYRCWQESTPIPSLDFTLAGDTYTDSAGIPGKVQATATVITFVGAALDGTQAKYRKDAPPTFSMLGPRGDDISTCQLTQ